MSGVIGARCESCGRTATNTTGKIEGIWGTARQLGQSSSGPDDRKSQFGLAWQWVCECGNFFWAPPPGGPS